MAEAAREDTDDRISVEAAGEELIKVFGNPHTACECLNAGIRFSTVRLWCNDALVSPEFFRRDLCVGLAKDGRLEIVPSRIGLRDDHYKWTVSREGLARITVTNINQEDARPPTPTSNLPAPASNPPPTPNPRGAGRGRMSARDLIAAECYRRFGSKGIPPDRGITRFAAKLLVWYEARFGEKNAPEERTVREWVSNWIKDWKSSSPLK